MVVLLSKTIEFIRMLRPVNSIMTGLAVVFTYFVMNNYSIGDYLVVAVGFITGFLVSSASMLVNDVVDINVDRVNKPWKPLPRGVFKPSTILYISIAFLATGFVINIFVSIEAFLVVVVLGSIAYCYSFLRRLWWSHYIVSLSTVAPFVYGYVLACLPRDKLYFILLFSIVIFLVNSSREFVKSIADIEGDKMCGYNTIAIVYGVLKASRLALVYAIIASILAVLIGLLGYAGVYYTVVLGVAGLLFTIEAYRVYRNPVREKCIRAKKHMLYYMLLALIGYLLSNL